MYWHNILRNAHVRADLGSHYTNWKFITASICIAYKYLWVKICKYLIVAGHFETFGNSTAKDANGVTINAICNDYVCMYVLTQLLRKFAHIGALCTKRHVPLIPPIECVNVCPAAFGLR